MRTITKTLYKFDELSEEAKKKAVENLCDINVEYDWWQNIYYDAQQVEIDILSFDLDRRSISVSFTADPEKVAEKIIENHGCFEVSRTTQLATNFLYDLRRPHKNDDEAAFDRVEELEEGFKKSLGDEYLKMLIAEHEYLESDTAIIETIEASDYEFDENGVLA